MRERLNDNIGLLSLRWSLKLPFTLPSPCMRTESLEGRIFPNWHRPPTKYPAKQFAETYVYGIPPSSIAFLTTIFSSNVTFPGSVAFSILAGSVPNSDGRNLYPNKNIHNDHFYFLTTETYIYIYRFNCWRWLILHCYFYIWWWSHIRTLTFPASLMAWTSLSWSMMLWLRIWTPETAQITTSTSFTASTRLL